MQCMIDQHRQTNETQARLQEQMAKKDKDHVREVPQV